MADREVTVRAADGSPLLDGPWIVIPFDDDNAHVVFVEELAGHELDRGCWCRPHVETHNPETGERNARAVVIHPNARERSERDA